jgi:hypothetical protein
MTQITLGRRRVNFQSMSARFPEGTFERMDALLKPREKRADMLREAVAREIARRKAQRKRKPS